MAEIEHKKHDDRLPGHYRVSVQVTDTEGEREFYTAQQVVDRDEVPFGLNAPPATINALALCITRIFSSTTTTTSARYGSVEAIDVRTLGSEVGEASA